MTKEIFDQLTPAERDDILLAETEVLGSAYLRMKRRRARKAGRKVRGDVSFASRKRRNARLD